MASPIFALVTFLLTLFFYSHAQACPDIQGLTDVNCDKKIVIVAFGDSITKGVRDETGLGYPGRLMILLPGVQVINLGVPGEQTIQGKSRAARLLPAIPEADYSIVLEGTNDYFLENASSTDTRSNLQAILGVSQSIGTDPVLGNLLAPNRTGQGIWAVKVNQAISSLARINFYGLGKVGVISSDNLHPNGEGYQKMAHLIISRLRTISLSNKPPDLDGDGVYDFAEPKYGASPHLFDTDGDGISDGDEIFIYGSNPASTDSDGDGFSDDYEINTLGSNPIDPAPSAPTIETLVVSNAHG